MTFYLVVQHVLQLPARADDLFNGILELSAGDEVQQLLGDCCAALSHRNAAIQCCDRTAAPKVTLSQD